MTKSQKITKLQNPKLTKSTSTKKHKFQKFRKYKNIAKLQNITCTQFTSTTGPQNTTTNGLIVQAIGSPLVKVNPAIQRTPG